LEGENKRGLFSREGLSETHDEERAMQRYRGRVFSAQDLQRAQKREPAESIPGPGRRPVWLGQSAGWGCARALERWRWRLRSWMGLSGGPWGPH